MSFLTDLDIGPPSKYDFNLNGPTKDGFVDSVRRRLSLAHVAYVCLGFGGSAWTEPVLAATYSDAWINYYKKNDYVRVDPVMIEGAKSSLPLDWRGLPRTTKRVRRFFGEAHDAGIGTQGLTIPVRGPTNGVWALLSATSEDSDSQWNTRKQELTKDLFFMAHQIHHWVYVLYGGSPSEINIVTLSRRETELLQRVAEGAKVADIASAMKITSTTVKSYLSNVRLKLHAANATRAVAIGFREGLIQ